MQAFLNFTVLWVLFGFLSVTCRLIKWESALCVTKGIGLLLSNTTSYMHIYIFFSGLLIFMVQCFCTQSHQAHHLLFPDEAAPDRDWRERDGCHQHISGTADCWQGWPIQYCFWKWGGHHLQERWPEPFERYHQPTYWPHRGRLWLSFSWSPLMVDRELFVH